MPELMTTSSPYVDSRVNSKSFTMGIGQPYARISHNHMPPESTLSTNQGLRIWPLVLLGKNANVNVNMYMNVNVNMNVVNICFY